MTPNKIAELKLTTILTKKVEINIIEFLFIFYIKNACY